MEDYSYRTKKVKVAGRKIQTYSFGDGPKTILALPSFPHSGSYFRWSLDNDKQLRKFNVITCDFPGWIGESENYKKGEKFKMEDFIEIVKEVVGKYHVGKFSILGYCFGGMIGVKVAADLPEKVDKIVLVSAVVNGPKLKEYYLTTPMRYLRFLPKKVVAKTYLYWGFRQYGAIFKKEGFDLELFGKYKKKLKGVSSKVLIDSILALFDLDFSEYLDRIKDKEILVVNSVDETEAFEDQADLIRERLNNKKNLSLKGGHGDFILKPNEKVFEKILDFLAQ